MDPAANFPNAEDVKIPVDGATFAHAWWIPAQSGTARTLLWFHGNGYPLEAEMQEEAPALYKTGANLLLVDYRGYGASSPVTTTAETTAADARAAFRYLTDDKHLAPSNIWIAGWQQVERRLRLHGRRLDRPSVQQELRIDTDRVGLRGGIP